jgi:hypothetical protein
MLGVGKVLDVALKLADTGMPVFPVLANKHPATPHSFKDASSDSAALRELWRRYPGPLVGVPTGGITGFDVLDFDTTKHPEAGDWWRANRHRLPPTRAHQTRSGGFHLLFRHDAVVRGVAGKICVGVDTRAAGNFIVWWPAHGHRVIDAPLAFWPDWLLAEFPRKPQPSVPASTTIRFCGDGWLRGLVRTIAHAPEGQRNSILFWAACRAGEAVRAGQADEDFAATVLVEAALRAGLPQAEARRTIDSGMQRS